MAQTARIVMQEMMVPSSGIDTYVRNKRIV
jgi:hypothetical protein